MSEMARPEFEIGVLFEAYAASNRVELFLNHVLGDIGLKPVGYAILSILANAEATPGEVARISGTRPSTLSGHIAHLTDQGWVSRQKGDDGRVAVLALTPAGHDIHALAEQRVAEQVKQMHQGMGMSMDAVRHAIRELSIALEAATEQT